MGMGKRKNQKNLAWIVGKRVVQRSNGKEGTEATSVHVDQTPGCCRLCTQVCVLRRLAWSCGTGKYPDTLFEQEQ